uniref:Uncharacterized protein n=1 Tax=Sphaerodactylus townsendi TaxID=933632 RepID=A0ACB8EF61_9SAUR
MPLPHHTQPSRSPDQRGCPPPRSQWRVVVFAWQHVPLFTGRPPLLRSFLQPVRRGCALEGKGLPGGGPSSGGWGSSPQPPFSSSPLAGAWCAFSTHELCGGCGSIVSVSLSVWEGSVARTSSPPCQRGSQGQPWLLCPVTATERRTITVSLGGAGSRPAEAGSTHRLEPVGAEEGPVCQLSWDSSRLRHPSHAPSAAPEGRCPPRLPNREPKGGEVLLWLPFNAERSRLFISVICLYPGFLP